MDVEDRLISEKGSNLRINDKEKVEEKKNDMKSKKYESQVKVNGSSKTIWTVKS